MKTEQEIVLQKKTFIIFSLLILVFALVILNLQKSTVLGASRNEIKKVYTNFISSEEMFKVEEVGQVEPVQLRVNNEEATSNTNNSVNSDSSSIDIDRSNYSTVASRGSFIRETNTPPTDYEKVISVRATAYCLCKKCTGKTPGSAGYGHTASGLVIKQGAGMKVLSVDPKVIPLGTQVYVDGYGYAIAADTGGAIKGNKIDVYKDTHTDALRWGVRTVNVYILKDE